MFLTKDIFQAEDALKILISKEAKTFATEAVQVHILCM